MLIGLCLSGSVPAYKRIVVPDNSLLKTGTRRAEEGGSKIRWREGRRVKVFHSFVRCIVPNRPNKSTTRTYKYIRAFHFLAVAWGYLIA